MSDPKRANLITVGAPKSVKKIVNKTVRLTINLVESNESKYPELNYKELVIAEEQRNKRLENGKTGGLDPFSDNDEDVERVAKKFEQKYGNSTPYRKKKRRSKDDDFADIGAGYDENDSFIDNTHGYDEMIPPNIDTLHGGFYINCGSLEFKTVPNDESVTADEPRRNKRRISSSSSEEESSDSSSGSESQDTKEPTAVANGALDSHKTEHRKKKNKKADKPKPKKVRRAGSSAANSGKQTPDDNIQPEGEGESVDSRTSHSDSVTSKPTPSSENAVTSDSSRDTESKAESDLPAAVTQELSALEASAARHRLDLPSASAAALLANNDAHIQRLEQVLSRCGACARVRRAARTRAAAALGVTRAALAARHKTAPTPPSTSTQLHNAAPQTTTDNAQPPAVTAPANKNKRKLVLEDNLDISLLSDDQRETMMLDTIKRLMDLIEEFKPSMFANYNLECERVREEKKKLTSDGATVEKRLPKRRFPWCHRSRSLLARITKLAGSDQAGAFLLADKILPLFPKGFVRMPTLMRQANIGKEVKVPENKRQRLGSATQNPLAVHPLNIPPQNNPIPPSIQTPPLFPEPILFPSSLTVTATNIKTSPDKNEMQTNKEVNLGHIVNSFSVSKDLIVERDKSEKKEELYIPPNNIGSITITPVPSQGSKKEKNNEKPQTVRKPEKPSNQSVAKISGTESRPPSSVQKTTVTDTRQPGSLPKTSVTDNRPPIATEKSLIRVKSPAVLNESYKKDVKAKKLDKPYSIPEKSHPNPKDRRIDTPLQIDTSFQTAKKDPSPKNKETSPRSKESLSQKQIESLRVNENNIPRPALVPVHLSPTFAKPDKRPERKKEIVDVKKKKEITIVSDLDPLSEHSDEDPVAIDDSSSDVEVIENVIENDKSESVTSEVPLKDNKVPKTVEESDDDIDRVMRNIREMEHSQEPTKFNSNSFSGVIDNSIAKHGIAQPPCARSRDRDKLEWQYCLQLETQETPMSAEN